MDNNFAVFIGRFQPFHNGHLSVIKQALEQAHRVLIFVGGADGARRPRNPWDFHERSGMIVRAMSADDYRRVVLIPLPDFTYNDTGWIRYVQEQVSAHVGMAKGTWLKGEPKIALIGRRKDNSGYYLNLFPQWASIEAKATGDINATDLRGALFYRNEVPGTDLVPPSTIEVLTQYLASPEGRRMQEECKFIAKYKRSHDDGVFHRNNVTADAVVVQGGNILVVRRKSLPGKGKLALPGGHVNRDELPRDAAVRELREETGIKVPEPALYGAIEKHQVFDDPYRSDLARTYTFAYLIRLKNEKGKLAKLKAGSDAESAFWMPINELRADEMFDDHYHIINALLGLG